MLSKQIFFAKNKILQHWQLIPQDNARHHQYKEYKYYIYIAMETVLLFTTWAYREWRAEIVAQQLTLPIVLVAKAVEVLALDATGF